MRWTQTSRSSKEAGECEEAGLEHVEDLLSSLGGVRRLSSPSLSASSFVWQRLPDAGEDRRQLCQTLHRHSRLQVDSPVNLQHLWQLDACSLIISSSSSQEGLQGSGAAVEEGRSHRGHPHGARPRLQDHRPALRGRGPPAHGRQ